MNKEECDLTRTSSKNTAQIDAGWAHITFGDFGLQYNPTGTVRTKCIFEEIRLMK